MKNHGNRGSVLIVEDDRLLTLVAERLLTKLGYSIAGKASNGADAIQAAKTTSPDLVIMDISLEGDMSGIEVAKKIRAFSDIPVIFLSGTSDKETFRHAKQTGFVDFLVKPITADDLIGPLNRAMALAKSGGSSCNTAVSHSLNQAG